MIHKGPADFPCFSYMNSYCFGMNAIVSEKGQVTIPKKIREQLGIYPGVVLTFNEEEGKLVARKKLAEDPFEKWVGRGRLPFGRNTDAYLRIIRGR